MRSALLLAAAGGLVQAMPQEMSALHKRQGVLGGIVQNAVNWGYGRVPAVPGAAPVRSVLEPRAGNGAKTVKVRYGPYKVPSGEKSNIMGEKGTLYNYPDIGVEKPCEECVLVGMNAGLEFPDGRDANTGDGLWLHHMVLINKGEGRMDPTCAGRVSLPHLVVGTTAAYAERMFSSGNERTRVLFSPPWAPESKLGYFLKKDDEFRFIVDLMNMNPKDEVVYMTLTYDYIEGRPAGFESMKAIWLDVAQCGTSEVTAPSSTGKFTIEATWTANIEAEVLGAGGHLHDGGDYVTLQVDGKEVCKSVATYGTAKGGGMGGGPQAASGGSTPTGESDSKAGMGGIGGSTTPANTTPPAASGPPAAAGGGHGHGGSGEGEAAAEHIVKMSPCAHMPIQRVEKGQKWLLQAHYDLDAHKGMKNGQGEQEHVMGISIMYVKNAKQ